MLTRLGMPRIAISIGAVPRVSSSSGVRPGARMVTSTCTGATSGKASIEILKYELAPHTASAAALRNTSRRCCSATEMMLPSIKRPYRGILCSFLVDVGEGGQQREHAAHRDLIAWLERRADRDTACGLIDHLHRAGAKTLLA